MKDICHTEFRSQDIREDTIVQSLGLLALLALGVYRRLREERGHLIQITNISSQPLKRPPVICGTFRRIELLFHVAWSPGMIMDASPDIPNKSRASA